MGAAILQAESLNLPELFARKLRGTRVELIENPDATITIKPVPCVIDSACGMLKSDGSAVDRHIARKRVEKALEA